MTIYYKNLYYIYKFQKCKYNKNLKLKKYIFYKKIWLNSKYIKIKKIKT